MHRSRSHTAAPDTPSAHRKGREPARAATAAGSARSGEPWTCRRCVNSKGLPCGNRAGKERCGKCNLQKGACFGAKQTTNGSPTFSFLDEASKANAALVKEYEAMVKANATLKAKLEEVGDKGGAADTNGSPAPSPEGEVALGDEDSATAKVNALREQFKAVSALPDNDVSTAILQQTKTQMLASLDKQLQDARAAVRDSKPLATQQMQVEAFFRKLNKAHDAEVAELDNAKEALQLAQERVAAQQAAVAESQLRIDATKKSAADIATRMAAELGAFAPAGTPNRFLPGTCEWSAIGEILQALNHSSVQAALLSSRIPQDHLQSLSRSVATVHAAGAEQARQAADTPVEPVSSTAPDLPPAAPSTDAAAAPPGHRPPGTAEAASLLVAEGKLQCSEIVAQMQRELSFCKSQLANVRQSWADMEADLTSEAESTATAADADGSKRQVSAKRRRKRIGEFGMVISNIK